MTHPNNLPPWWHWNSASNVNVSYSTFLSFIFLLFYVYFFYDCEKFSSILKCLYAMQKYASMDGVNKSGRQVLMACDGNTKCLPQDPYSMAHGKNIVTND